MIGKPTIKEIAFIETSDIPVGSFVDIAWGTISIAEIRQHTPLKIPVTLNPGLRKLFMLSRRNSAGAKHARMNLKTMPV